MDHPDLTIYAVRDAASGKLEPVAVSLGGFSLPILRASIVADPNATSTGTRALVGEIAFTIGGGGIEEVASPDDVPGLEPFPS